MTNAKQKNQGKKTSVARQYGVDRTIVLVGLMGAGKTTVGRRLARKLNLPFVDSDHEIEKAAGMSVAEIFECFGEADFRSGERRVIERLLDGKPQIVATGGGAFINEATRALIKDKGLSIWLDADIDVLVERTGRRDTRPLLKTGDPKEILTRLAEERAPFYAEADLKVASSNGPHEDVVGEILSALKARKAA
ncbi:shikimate kinase [Kordiimonas lipolytica]|uniref:Shikimate kinase n=1 Tax=Kordiimonas lipolytica TaxID=1662421 RepID=A0ABV8U4Y2_9PROT|nr:shikimate kinase [Kordiimonas lipolytica]